MDKADCIELMGYRIIGNLCFAIWLGSCTGNCCAGVYESNKKILEWKNKYLLRVKVIVLR